MSHTPGPWHCHTNGSEFSVTAEDHNGATCYLARIDKFRTRHGDYADEANAKLIAAAPELLEACKLSLRNTEDIIYKQPAKIMDSVELQSLRTWRDTLKDAIAKATQ